MVCDGRHQLFLEGGIRIAHFIAMVIISFYGNDMAIFVCLRTFQAGLGRDDIVERIADDEDRLITEAISMLAGVISFELRKTTAV